MVERQLYRTHDDGEEFEGFALAGFDMLRVVHGISSHAQSQVQSQALLLALTACVIAGCGEALPTRPNVVLVVLDSLRADALSFTGYERQTSPRLDAFARENLIFDDAVTVAASTAPAMAAMMSGRMPYYEKGAMWTTLIGFGLHRFLQPEEGAGLPLALDTLAERLHREGYATGGFITNSHLKAVFHFDQGFDVFEEMLTPKKPRADRIPYSPAEDLTQRGIQWMDTVGDAPFFLYLHYMDTHYPYLPPEPSRDVFHFPRVPGASDASVQSPWLREDDLDAPQRRNIAAHMRGLYDSEIRYADHWIGALLDHLDSRGLADETLVVITSDHGEEFLEHGNTVHKGKLYEELVRVPLLMRVPGRGPARFAVAVRNFDLMPTILDYCGVDPPPDLDAWSLRPLIDQQPGEPPPPAVASFPKMPWREPTRMIRTERYKFLQTVTRPELGELYDLLQDPDERENLYAERTELAESLTGRLDDAFAKLAEEATRSKVDFRLFQPRAKERHAEDLRHALEFMSPKQRNERIQQGLSRMSADERAAALHEGVDEESAEQLRAIGYID